MSKGAFNELLQAPPAIFKSMTKNIPNSEKREVLKILRKRVKLLGNLR